MKSGIVLLIMEAHFVAGSTKLISMCTLAGLLAIQDSGTFIPPLTYAFFMSATSAALLQLTLDGKTSKIIKFCLKLQGFELTAHLETPRTPYKSMLVMVSPVILWREASELTECYDNCGRNF